MKQSYFLALLTLLIFFSMPVPAAAFGLEYYGIQDLINDDLTTDTIIGLQFTEPISKLDFNLNFRVYNLTTHANFDSAECTVSYMDKQSLISCRFEGMTEEKNFLTLSFKSRGRVVKKEDGYQFVSNYGISVPVNESFIIIKLPENSVLMKEIANESFSPGDGTTGSDGKHITVHWQRSGLGVGNDLEFSVLYTMPFGGPLFNILIVSMTGVVLVVMTGLAIYIKGGGPAETATSTEEAVSSVLTPDEKTIVDILKSNEYSAMQKVLVRSSEFSKAKVSRLVKSLSSRGIIEVEPMGRTNKIKLTIDREQVHGTKNGKEPTSVPGSQEETIN